jgi:mono/diheme cytochrome c family protein
MILLLLLPFYDRGPERRPERRPIAMTAMLMTIIVMAYLTYAGANVGPPSGPIAVKVPPQYEPGKAVVAQSACLACHKIGETGNGTLAPDLTHVGSRIPRNAILRSLKAGPSIMPSFKSLGQKKLNEVADFLSYLK